jgi:hypothetical protein
VLVGKVTYPNGTPAVTFEVCLHTTADCGGSIDAGFAGRAFALDMLLLYFPFLMSATNFEPASRGAIAGCPAAGCALPHIVLLMCTDRL